MTVPFLTCRIYFLWDIMHFFSGKQALAKSYFESLIPLCDERIRHFNERKIISNQDEWIPHAFKTFAYAYLGIKDKAIAEADITSTLNPISREA